MIKKINVWLHCTQKSNTDYSFGKKTNNKIKKIKTPIKGNEVNKKVLQKTRVCQNSVKRYTVTFIISALE